MNHILSKYCPRIDFDSYEDFYVNFKIKAPQDFNFGFDVVDEWARVEPDKQALIWCDDDDREKVFTFTDIKRLSNKFANVLRDLGIGKGDVCILMLRQRYEYWICAVALHKVGAILIPATTQLNSHDIVYRVQASGAKLIVAHDEPYVHEQIQEAKKDCPNLQNVIAVDSPQGLLNAGEHATDPADGWLDFDVLMQAAHEEFPRPAADSPLATHNDDIMLIYFTSGTTGLAKMAAHCFTYPLGHILTAKYWQQVQENKLHCSVSDSGWAKFGWGKIYGQWICGAVVFAYDDYKFDPLKLLQKIQDYKVTTFCVPPTMYRFMLQEDVASFDLSSVQNFTTAGEPLNADVTIQWEKATGKKIREGLGQSEGPVLVATVPWIEPKPGSTGKPMPLLNIKLLDDEGHEVEEGEEGNICVTGLRQHYPVGLFVGYYKDAEKTAEAVGGEYYNLHDVAWFDSEGYFHFVGRSDDVIKCSGYRISPFEVESVLIEHPAVLECAVTAAPDPVRGKVVKATIQLARGYSPSDELKKELQDYVKHHTAPYKYPRIVEFVDELPKTVGGKIKRAKIRIEDEGGKFAE
jgi:acetyl-CoA synthetase